MATKQITRNIALTPHFDEFVQSYVDSGRYQSASEVIRDGLRLLEEREEQRKHALSQLRHGIEVAWEQSERGEMLDGRTVMDEIRNTTRPRRARAK